MKEQLKEFLEEHCTGLQNARTSKFLAAFFRTDERTIRETIHELRAEEIPILSMVQRPYGYFIPSKDDPPAEIAKCTNHFYTRMRSIYAASKGVEAGLKILFPPQEKQLKLPEVI